MVDKSLQFCTIQHGYEVYIIIPNVYRHSAWYSRGCWSFDLFCSTVNDAATIHKFDAMRDRIIMKYALFKRFLRAIGGDDVYKRVCFLSLIDQ